MTRPTRVRGRGGDAVEVEIDVTKEDRHTISAETIDHRGVRHRVVATLSSRGLGKLAREIVNTMGGEIVPRRR